MPDVEIVDANGLSCPQPAFMTKQAIDRVREGRIDVLVDNGTSRDNVSRLARRAGWTVVVEEEPGGGFRLVLER